MSKNLNYTNYCRYCIQHTINEDGSKLESFATIELLHVDSAERRQGKASLMLNQAIIEIESSGVRTIILFVQPFGDDKISIRELCAFYEKFGFMACSQQVYPDQVKMVLTV